jgi:HD-GYP domain-containing protein (c-di-GMP phosphodiesterase class II)
MLTDRLGLPPTVSRLFAFESERWDGKGLPGAAKGPEIPLPVRIVHIARDVAVQEMLGDGKYVADVIGERSGAAFDPQIAALVTENADEVVSVGDEASPWDAVLAHEPQPWLMLEGAEIDQALEAMGEFSDVASPYLIGHSAGVARLVSDAGRLFGLDRDGLVQVRRAAQVHDLGRVAVPLRIWEKAGALTSNDWEAVRLHAYHSERILVRSPFLSDLAPIAGFHHERLDGSGYHRGSSGPGIEGRARLLAVADVFHAMCEPRPHRPPLSTEAASEALTELASRGLLDPEAVAAVSEVAGHRVHEIVRPAGLTDRETEVVRLLVRGLQTKQVARRLGISPKTADRHVQNAYRKMGVSTRAGASLFAMHHGLATWGELPIPTGSDLS